MGVDGVPRSKKRPEKKQMFSAIYATKGKMANFEK